MLYYYFQSKEGLFVAALERMSESFRDQQRDLSVRASDPLLRPRGGRAWPCQMRKFVNDARGPRAQFSTKRSGLRGWPPAFIVSTKMNLIWARGRRMQSTTSDSLALSPGVLHLKADSGEQEQA
jgi:AcrR family transcriptional regulator